MTIGPEPRTRTLLIEVVAGSLRERLLNAAAHEVEKSVEEVLVIQRTWGRFGMKLDAQDRQIAVCEPSTDPSLRLTRRTSQPELVGTLAGSTSNP